MGRIVAAPTAGSCGIIPGVLLAVGERLGSGDLDRQAGERGHLQRFGGLLDLTPGDHPDTEVLPPTRHNQAAPRGALPRRADLRPAAVVVRQGGTSTVDYQYRVRDPIAKCRGPVDGVLRQRDRPE